MYDALFNYAKYMKFPGGNLQTYYPTSYATRLCQLLQSETSLNRVNQIFFN